jgi:hypothetical protein
MANYANLSCLKKPSELDFPKYPEGAKRLGARENIIKVRSACIAAYVVDIPGVFKRLDLWQVNDYVVVKIVSPMLYYYGGKEGAQCAILQCLLNDCRYRAAEFGTSVEHSLKSLYVTYIYIGPRGRCTSSKLVVTAFKGKPLYNLPTLLQQWNSGVKYQHKFFSQVCVVALDIVQYLGFAHYDIRVPNIVYGKHEFALIDWENVLAITCTGHS